MHDDLTIEKLIMDFSDDVHGLTNAWAGNPDAVKENIQLLKDTHSQMGHLLNKIMAGAR